MLERTRKRLSQIKQLGRLGLDHDDPRHLAQAVDHSFTETYPSPKWFRLLVAQSPRVIALGGRHVIDAALYSGIPRRFNTLEPPTAAYLLFALALKTEAHDKFLHAVNGSAPIESGNATDIVLIACEHSWDQLQSVSERLSAAGLSDLAEAISVAAFVALVFGPNPESLATQSLPWNRWSEMFFDAPEFRGARRRAARRGGAKSGLEDEVQSPRFIDAAMDRTFECDGFSFFAAEWLIAASKAAMKKNTRASDLSQHSLLQAGRAFTSRASSIVASKSCSDWISDRVVRLIETHEDVFQLD